MTPAAAELRETHISLVMMLGDRAYKLKKPVRLDFVDLTTREARERICHREVELNQRIAPDVYLGVADVVGPDGNVCDHLVVMRRMPDDRRLSTLVRSGAAVNDHLRQVARVVASFHSTAETSAEIASSSRAAAIRAKWEATFRTVQPHVGAILVPDVEERIRGLARRFLDGRAALFDQRIAEGKVLDGHGDLLADDIFCLDDGPRILDCVEFDDQIRYGDVLADTCFLAMDLERLGAPNLGERFLSWYRELSAETYPFTLAHHYVAFRAHIRAMVACLRATQGDDAAAADAAGLLDIARNHLEQGQVVLVLVGGLPGTGKSTLAAGLADRFGWSVLRSDEVRKDLAGVRIPSVSMPATAKACTDRPRPRPPTVSCSSAPIGCSTWANRLCSMPRGPTGSSVRTLSRLRATHAASWSNSSAGRRPRSRRNGCGNEPGQPSTYLTPHPRWPRPWRPLRTHGHKQSRSTRRRGRTGRSPVPKRSCTNGWGFSAPPIVRRPRFS
jgi:aminoglycoside phosphotransferase family enzyme